MRWQKINNRSHLCAVHLHCAQQTTHISQDEDDRKSIIALCDLFPKIHVFMYSCFRWFSFIFRYFKFFKWKESFIFRYFKVFQVSQMFTYSLSDLLLLAVGSLVVFVLREYILKVHILVSTEHKLCQIWNTCIVYCIYIDQLLF